MLYGIIRVAEPAHEHVDNNFTPIDVATAERYCKVRNKVVALMNNVAESLRNDRAADNVQLLNQCEALEEEMNQFNQDIGVAIQGQNINLSAMTLVLHMGQETLQLIIEIHDLLVACKAYRELI